jgi:hypothetical protein
MASIIALLAAWLSAAPANTPWQIYTDQAAAFQVEIPGEFQLQADSIETAIGTMVYHRYLCIPAEKPSGVSHFALHFSQYPPGTLSPDSIELIKELLQETVESTARNLEATVIYTDDILLDEIFQGKFWRMDLKNGKVVAKSKAYFVNDRFYMLQTLSPLQNNKNEDTDRFFNSFKLLHE